MMKKGKMEKYILINWRERETENGAKDQKAAHVLEAKQSVMIVTRREKTLFFGFLYPSLGVLVGDVVIIVDEME
jgi:hypothetical protein